MTNVVLFGSNGNIGIQTLEVVEKNRIDFNFVGLGFGHSLKSLPKYLEIFPNIKNIYIYKKIKDCKNFPKLNFFYGNLGLKKFLRKCDPDIVVNAVSGFAGLKYSLECIKGNFDIALANKESLVCGASVIKDALQKSKSTLYPVDSEHSTLFKLIDHYGKENISELIITASGGAFRDLSHDQLNNISIEEALNHPTWKMGKKVTIDSDSLMNKTYEIIEAFHLFNFDPNKIKVLIEKTSNIHSLIKLNNGKFSAEIYPPTMLNPIECALRKFNSNYSFEEQDSLSKYKQILEEPSFERFPFLKFGFEIIKSKGNINGLILNAINEVCVNKFLDHKIKFLDIEKIVFDLFRVDDKVYNLNYRKLFSIDKKFRYMTEKYIKENF